MNKSEFLLEQFRALRNEIDETKARIFKILTFGIIIVPTGQILSEKLNVSDLILFLPLLVITISLMYLAENHALMRCGNYIHSCIEKEVPDTTGWEAWLEANEKLIKTRSVDSFLSLSFYMLFCLYYIFSTYLAVGLLVNRYGDMIGLACSSIYLIMGIMAMVYLLFNIKNSTSSKRP